MADFVHNISLGRVAEFYYRVKNNDPAGSALVIVAIDANGDTDAAMKDRADLAALLGGTANEVTNTNYARKVLTDADLAAFATDNANDRTDLTIPNQTFANILAGSAWTDLVLCYDPDTASGTDSSIVPMINFDYPMTPDGSSLIVQVNAAGFFRAS